MSVGRGKNVVAERAKGCAHEFAEHLFILHQKNSDVSRRCGRNRGLGWLDGDFRRRILEDAITDGQISANYRAVAGRALHFDPAVMLLEHAIDGSHAHARAFAWFLGGEERLEDAAHGGRVHPVSAVFHRQADVAAELGLRIAPAVSLVDLDGRRRESKPAAIGHGVTGIKRKIHNDLIDATRIGENERKLRRQACVDCDVFADHTAKHADRLLDDFIQLQGPALDHLFAAVGQELVGERGCAHGRLLNLAKIRGEFLFEFPGLHHRRVSEDDGKHVVEVVSNAGGEAADGFHLLRLAKFIFKTHTIGDVLKDKEMVGSAAECQILCRNEHLTQVAGSRANARREPADETPPSECVVERAVGLGIAPPLRPTGEHGLARRANKIQKAGICVEAVRAVGLLDDHGYRTTVESFGESLFGTSQGILGCDTLGHFIGETGVGLRAAGWCAGSRARRVPPFAGTRSV